MTQDSVQSLMMLAGIGIAAWLLMRGKMTRRKLKHQPSVIAPLKHNQNATAQPEAFTGKQSLGAPKEVLRWQVELHDLGRELKAELDTKMLAVRRLTLEYDQASQRLSRLIQLADQIDIKPQSVLATVRDLSLNGWDAERIAAHLSIDKSDVDLMLNTRPTLPQQP